MTTNMTTNNKKLTKDDDIRKARDFFANIVKIYGENQLYKSLYGELPIDEDSEERIRKQVQMLEDAKPLKDIIAEHIRRG
jgi:hypothetical protein